MVNWLVSWVHQTAWSRQRRLGECCTSTDWQGGLLLGCWRYAGSDVESWNQEGYEATTMAMMTTTMTTTDNGNYKRVGYQWRANRNDHWKHDNLRYPKFLGHAKPDQWSILKQWSTPSPAPQFFTDRAARWVATRPISPRQPRGIVDGWWRSPDSSW